MPHCHKRLFFAAGGYVNGLRVGLLPIDANDTVAAVGDVKLACPTPSGAGQWAAVQRVRQA